jgi:hypothetical protein
MMLEALKGEGGEVGGKFLTITKIFLSEKSFDEFCCDLLMGGHCCWVMNSLRKLIFYN